MYVYTLDIMLTKNNSIFSVRRPVSIWQQKKPSKSKSFLQGKGGNNILSNVEEETKSERMVESKWFNAFLSYSMQEKFLPVSHQADRINESSIIRIIRLVLAILAILIIIYEAPKSTSDLKDSTDLTMYILDIIVTVGFLLDAVVRFLSIPMQIRVEQAFGRTVNYSELVLNGGVRDFPVVLICLAFGLTDIGTLGPNHCGAALSCVSVDYRAVVSSHAHYYAYLVVHWCHSAHEHSLGTCNRERSTPLPLMSLIVKHYSCHGLHSYHHSIVYDGYYGVCIVWTCFICRE